MLYGCTYSESFLTGGKKSRFLMATVRMCSEINRILHDMIPYPQNWDCLPNKLALKISEKPAIKANKRWLNDEQVKYLEMVDDLKTNAKIEGEFNYGSYYKALGPFVRKHSTGNCGEYCSVACNLMIKRGTDSQRIRLVSGWLEGEDNNHICLAVDVASDADPSDPSSYGPDCVICDPWLDLVATPAEYFACLREIECPFVPSGLRSLTETPA